MTDLPHEDPDLIDNPPVDPIDNPIDDETTIWRTRPR